MKLALAGAALTALLTSLTSSVLLLDVQTLDVFRFWNVGSLAGRDADVVAQVALFLLAGVALALASAGAEHPVARRRRRPVARPAGPPHPGLSALSIVLLCGAATAAAGPIGFVGLTVPHVARAICGPDYKWILPWSLVLAPTLLLSADVVGRLIARPGEVQVGVVTAPRCTSSSPSCAAGSWPTCEHGHPPLPRRRSSCAPTAWACPPAPPSARW